MKDLLVTVLGKFDLRNKLIGQTYDGASVIAVQLNGVQRLVKESAPHAFFTVCLAHRVNLVLQQSCLKISSARILFATLQGIPAFFHQSSKRTSVLNRIVGNRIPTSGEVRWNSNAKITATVLTERKILVDIFNKIGQFKKLPTVNLHNDQRKRMAECHPKRYSIPCFENF